MARTHDSIASNQPARSAFVFGRFGLLHHEGAGKIPPAVGGTKSFSKLEDSLRGERRLAATYKTRALARDR